MKEIPSLASLKFLLLKGDGIGPEIMDAAAAVLDCVGEIFSLDLSKEYMPIGFDSLEACGTTFHDDVLTKALSADGVILGPVSHNEYPSVRDGGLNPSGELRKRLDLFANIRPALSRPGISPKCGAPVDLVVVRENTEGFYADRTMFLGPGEFMPTPDVALSMRKITRNGSMRIARKAFEVAATRRKKVTAVHKANVLHVTDGLFLACCREVAREYSDIVYEERLVDAMSAYLVRDITQFDVILCTNMFGDILSDQASEIAGSLGLAASLNVGSDRAIAQAQHGAALDIAGKGIANPVSLIGSLALLLEWLGRKREDAKLCQASTLINCALDRVISVPSKRTRDLGGVSGTREFSDNVILSMKEIHEGRS